MADEEPKKKVTIETLTSTLSTLRLRVSEFQDNIEAFIVSLEEMSRSIKSRFASIEARLASLEVQLSSLGPSPDWEAQEFDHMLSELDGIGDDLTMMRQTWNALTQGLQQRVN
jgi:chaperonin cofactor prefoldin